MYHNAIRSAVRALLKLSSLSSTPAAVLHCFTTGGTADFSKSAMSLFCKTSRSALFETKFVGSRTFCTQPCKQFSVTLGSWYLSGVLLRPRISFHNGATIKKRIGARLELPIQKQISWEEGRFRSKVARGASPYLTEVVYNARRTHVSLSSDEGCLKKRKRRRSSGIVKDYAGWRGRESTRTITTSVAVAVPTTEPVGSYDADQIQVLEGLDPVRKRPGMYIGSTGPRGLHHLVWEVLDNSIDEVQAGFATHIDVELLADGSVSVSDDGRGIPTGLHPSTGKSAVETVLTVLHAGGKFGGDSSGYAVSGGLHGVGISVVNALSENLQVNVWRNGQEFEQFYKRGKPVTELIERPLSEDLTSKSGTRVIFKPDHEVFTTSTEFDYHIIAGRLRELAFLNSEVTIRFKQVGDQIVRSDEYHFAGGLDEYVLWLNQDKERLHDPISIRRERDGMTVDVALQWCADAYTDTILGYANSVRTSDGGTHLDGMKAAITRTLNSLGRKMKIIKEKDENLTGDHAREGLTCIVAVKVPNPEFEGQTKTRLGNQEVRRMVEQAVAELVTEYLETHPDVLDTILSKAIQAFKAAMAAKKARELVRRKNVLKSAMLPGKLSDCSCTDARNSEIFIVEGDSAGGSAKQGRDRKFQAVLPLRGKILNIERKDDAAIYKNREIQDMIIALGLGVKGEEFSLDTLRYHKIIILTDADVDGAHIRTLLLTFLFRYQRELFEAGCIYVGVPPLYKVERGKHSTYCYDEQELKTLLKSYPANASYTIQRFKGLGEMMPLQLWDTTLDPTKRTLRQLTLIDAAEASQRFAVLMGSKVEPRKELIRNSAYMLGVETLDV